MKEVFYLSQWKSQKESFPSVLVLMLVTCLPICSVSLISRYMSKKALRLFSGFPKGLTQETQKGTSHPPLLKILSQLLPQFKGL